MAVPGAVQNRAAAGTNQLIRDGATPVTDPSRRAARARARPPPRRTTGFDPRPLPRGIEAAVLERCRAEASTLDHVVAGFGLGVAEAAMALARLERSGWVRDAGGWFEPVLA